MTMNKGMLIVFSGPSGVGKDTVVANYLKTDPNSILAISLTTRPPREGEVHGQHYYFVTEEAFMERVNSGAMLEHAIYGGNHYGTPCSEVEGVLNNGKNVILVIDVQGAEKVRTVCPTSLQIFVAPPSLCELEKRLTGRGKDTGDNLSYRLCTASKELSLISDYDYVVVNDVLEKTVEQVATIISAARFSTKHMSEDFMQMLKGVCE